MPHKGLFRPCREATEARLSERLPTFGFTSEPRHFQDGAFRRWWIRDLSWRRDIVELVFRRGGEISMLFNLIIQLPEVMAEEPGDQLEGRGVDTPILPYWFGSLRVASYSRRVARLVEAELPWFDRHATPSASLQLLRARENNGPQGGQLWQQMQERLSKLAEGVA